MKWAKKFLGDNLIDKSRLDAVDKYGISVVKNDRILHNIPSQETWVAVCNNSGHEIIVVGETVRDVLDVIITELQREELITLH